jgi:hypothetical protein
MMIEKETEMTDLEKTIRWMLTDEENVWLDKCLNGNPNVDGSLAQLVAEALRARFAPKTD